MNNNLTEVIFIMDMSGSMFMLTDDTIGGFNTLIEQQKKEDGEAKVTTVLFDNRYILLHDNVDINSVEKMTTAHYMPCGSTALLDAIGKTVNSVGQRLSATPEDERPGKVVVTIITDGMDNVSHEFTWEMIKKMITHQREKYSWVFTFIGANIDTMKVSSNLGIDPKLSKKYTASSSGTSSVYSAVSKSLSYVRSVDSSNVLRSCAVTDQMSDILDEVE